MGGSLTIASLLVCPPELSGNQQFIICILYVRHMYRACYIAITLLSADLRECRKILLRRP